MQNQTEPGFKTTFVLRPRSNLSQGAKPTCHWGTEPTLHLGAKPTLHLGAEPILHLGAEPTWHLDAEPIWHSSARPIRHSGAKVHKKIWQFGHYLLCFGLKTESAKQNRLSGIE